MAQEESGLPDVEEDLVDEIDIEETAASGRRRPRAKRYRFRVDKDRLVVTAEKLTGRDILTVSGRTPPEHWLLSQKFHGGKVISIGLNDVVDLREPGIERFMTLPKDQTEG
jgi:hypothetical protein